MNMLKDMLGEEIFFLGMREFFDRFKYQSARTNDFVTTLSEISQRDLGPFFDVWFKSYTLPKVDVSHYIEGEADRYRLKFQIFQEGTPFIFPLWLEWVEDGKTVRKMIVVDKKEYTVQFDLAHKAKRIRINPDDAVPGKFY
jgi:aminopeptidase N